MCFQWCYSLTLCIISSCLLAFLSSAPPLLSQISTPFPYSLASSIFCLSSAFPLCASFSRSPLHLPPFNLRFVPIPFDLCTLSTAQCSPWIRTVYTHTTLPFVPVCPGPKTRSGEINGSFLCFQICVLLFGFCFLRLKLLLLLFSLVFVISFLFLLSMR